MKRHWAIFAACLAFVLLALAIVFGVERGLFCAPISGTECAVWNWNRLGDFVLLKWFHDWQTLVAGTLAIIAAFIGGAFINAQIQQSERHEQERIRRRH